MLDKIPKIIHYCWFGSKEKPAIVKKCIDSWKSRLPDYEIKEWNEDNFDVFTHKFTAVAYEMNNFAYVSDYVRLYVLKEYGGFYLDTDTEIIKSLNPLLNHESVWGFEERNYIATSFIGAKPENDLISDFIDYYDGIEWCDGTGNIKKITNVTVVSRLLESKGILLNGHRQEIKVATVYPQEYFSPYDYINCYMKATNNTYAIHHFYKSWLPFNVRVKSYFKKLIVKVIGGHRLAKLREKLQGEERG